MLRRAHSAQTLAVVVHGMVRASTTGHTKNGASRKESFQALLAVERDTGFLERTCDCRTLLASKKQAKGMERAANAAVGAVKKGRTVECIWLSTKHNGCTASDSSIALAARMK